MHDEIVSTRPSAAETVAIYFGVLAGIGGLTHGIGEALQGNVKPGGLIVNSWAQGPIATNMGGEPAMTFAPNMLAAGLLTSLISIAVVIWSLIFIRRKRGGRVLIGLSLAMLLTGGGFGPPLIGLLAGAAGARVHAPRRPRPQSQRRLVLARLWPWLFAVAAFSGTFLVVGSLILVFVFGLNNAALFLNTFYLTVLSLLLTVLATPAYDQRPAQHVADSERRISHA